MTAAYATAANPVPYRILGQKLKPFCLGHYLHLQSLGVAFVSEGPSEAGMSDLICGVTVCSQSYEEFKDLLEDPKGLDEIKKWGGKFPAFDLKEKIQLFAQYIKEGSEMPKFWDESEGRPSGAHWTQAVKLLLTSELGYTNSEALNAPLSQAFSDFFKFCEGRGTVRLMTAAEIEMIEAAKQLQQEATCPA